MECKVFDRCGGCQYPHRDYVGHLREKQRMLENMLGSFGSVSPIIPMENPYYYRNKVNTVYRLGKHRELLAGNYMEESHHLVPVEHCLIEDQKIQEIVETLVDFIPSFKWTIYDEDRELGLLRHSMIRRGDKSGEILLVLVVTDPMIRGKKNFVKAILQKHPEIKSIVFNLNDKKTSMVLGKKNITAYGPGYIVDELCGKRFRISPNSFYQVNSNMTKILYEKAIDMADLKVKDRVLDIYCGIGTLGIIMADKVRKVTGVELSLDAVRDAITNAKINNVHNIRFVAADAGAYLIDEDRDFDVIFLDPPRGGCEARVLEELRQKKPERLIYISCNPETLARDLEILKADFKVLNIQPLDMFPWTKHVESVVLLKNL